MGHQSSVISHQSSVSHTVEICPSSSLSFLYNSTIISGRPPPVVGGRSSLLATRARLHNSEGNGGHYIICKWHVVIEWDDFLAALPKNSYRCQCECVFFSHFVEELWLRLVKTSFNSKKKAPHEGIFQAVQILGWASSSICNSVLKDAIIENKTRKCRPYRTLHTYARNVQSFSSAFFGTRYRLVVTYPYLSSMLATLVINVAIVITELFTYRHHRV